MHSENPALWRIQDRSRHQRAVDSAVGNRESAARHIGDRELARARARGELGHLLLDIEECHLVRAAKHRHDEPALSADRDANIIVVVIDHIAAVNRGIHFGNALERLNAAAREKRHEAQRNAVLGFERVLMLVSDLHHRAHIDFVESREDGGRVLGVNEAFGDTRAKAGHRNSAVARLIRKFGVERRFRGSRWSSGRRRRWRCGRSTWAACGLLEHVALGDAAVFAGACDGGSINSGFRNEFARGGSHRAGSWRGRSYWSCRCCGSRRCGSRRSRGRGRGIIDRADDLADRDAVAGILQSGQYSGRFGDDLDRRFVGFDLEDQLAFFHGLPRGLVPLQDADFGDRFAHSRSDDVVLHLVSLRSAQRQSFLNDFLLFPRVDSS